MSKVEEMEIKKGKVLKKFAEDWIEFQKEIEIITGETGPHEKKMLSKIQERRQLMIRSLKNECGHTLVIWMCLYPKIKYDIKLFKVIIQNRLYRISKEIPAEIYNECFESGQKNLISDLLRQRIVFDVESLIAASSAYGDKFFSKKVRGILDNLLEKHGDTFFQEEIITK